MKKWSLNRKMAVALIAGSGCGILFMLWKQQLLSSGQTALWERVYRWLFADISAPGNETAIGLFYVIGKLFVRCLQLVIIPMVFTSIVSAMMRISDATKLSRISLKTLGFFLFTTVMGILLASIFGLTFYHLGFFNRTDLALTLHEGSVAQNPLNIVVNAVPDNITTAFSQNSGVLAVVVLATTVGFLCHQLQNKIHIIPQICEEVNAIIVQFLLMVIHLFSPLAIFCLLTRSFACYGSTYLRPALSYIGATTLLLLIFLIGAYSLFVKQFVKVSPLPFLRKMGKIAMFGFSTSSSAATLPLNMQTTVKELGVQEEIASFVLPLGMTINMDGTAIMQIMATIFIAGCAGYPLPFSKLLFIGILAIVASVGTPAAPGAGAVILFTILSGVGFTSEAALTAYSLILAINRPIEMLVTALNVVGDSACALAVAKSEGAFAEETYLCRKEMVGQEKI